MYIISNEPVVLNNRSGHRWLIHESNMSSKEAKIWLPLGKTEQSDIKKKKKTHDHRALHFDIPSHICILLNQHVPLLLTNGLLVGLSIKQVVKLCGVCDLDLSNPGITLGALVDELGIVLQDCVTLDHRAGDRTVDVGSRLDRLHSSNGFAGGDLGVDLRKLNEHNVSQGLGGVLCDSDLGYSFIVSITCALRLDCARCRRL